MVLRNILVTVARAISCHDWTLTANKNTETVTCEIYADNGQALGDNSPGQIIWKVDGNALEAVGELEQVQIIVILQILVLIVGNSQCIVLMPRVSQ